MHVFVFQIGGAGETEVGRGGDVQNQIEEEDENFISRLFAHRSGKHLKPR